MWDIRDPKISSVEELVVKNTGVSASELLNDTKEYKISSLSKAADKLREAAIKGTFVTVVGDYDVDGITASAIMDKILSELKIPHRIRLPKRFKEGYGLKDTIVDEVDNGILFTVDNGIVAFDAIKKAKDKGLFVIVTDHHQKSADGKLPEADILVDPSAFPETADFSSYCGAGIVYKLGEELFGKDHPLMKKLSVFAALGTVADVMPLIKDNRKIVREGLKNFVAPGGCTQGLCSLKSAMNIKYGITSTDISFGFGPALNAAGRLEGTTINVEYTEKDGTSSEEDVVADAMMSFHILADKFDSWSESDKLAMKIKTINQMRKELKKIQYALVTDIVDKEYSMDAPIVVYLPKLHLGIIGILAGNLAEDYGVPAIVFTDDPKDPDLIKASARTAGGVNLKELLDSCSEDIVQYGGHAGAAGLSIKRSMIDKFREDLNDKLSTVSFSKSKLKYDFEIKESEVDDYLKELDKFGPYGEGNPEPLFLIKNYRLIPAGGSLFSMSGEDHVFMQGSNTKANAFFLQNKFKQIKDPRYLDIVCTLGYSYDMYGNQNPTVFIKDLQQAENPPEIKRSEIFKRLAEQINKEERLVV